MSIFKKIRAENFNFLYFLIPLMVSGLLIMNASRNNGGMPVLNSLNKEIIYAENKLELIKAEISVIENRVNLIKGPEIDPDLLEELAYKYLGYSYESDLFIQIK